MKRYISGILIPCLLLQLYGCYYPREMSIEELKSFDGSNEIRIKTTTQDISIQRRLDGADPMDWEAGDSLIFVKTKEQPKWENNYKVVDKITEIKFNEIKSIEIDELDSENTVVLVVSLVALAAMIGLAIAGSMQPDFSNMQF